MSTRRALLTDLFRRLDERQLPWCVLRNYTDLLDDATSDVDLLTRPDRVMELLACCEAAARATGQQLVQRTRFVNHSLVFWDGREGFLRIDVDTEKRWRRFHLLTAAQILQRRRRREPFYIPDPAHEAVILLTQALWQNQLSGRYCARLRELDQAVPDKDSLAAVFGEAFGLRENLLAQLGDVALPERLKRAVRRSACRQPARAARSLGYVFADAARLLARLKSPPGIAVRAFGVDETNLDQLRSRLAILFPLQKGTGGHGSSTQTALRRTLFKGGLSVESWPATVQPARLMRDGWRAPGRSFAALREPEGCLHLLHIGTGFMRSSHGFAGEFADFIGSTLARQLEGTPPARTGLFAVLVGLDGSGKTTLARNLARLVAEGRDFSGMRYFHWLPGLRRSFEFPLPEPRNLPRKEKLADGFVQSLLSTGRLLKNLLRARLGYWLQLRPLLRRGQLVLVDRYFYNYELDPVSVKYAGPAWLLAWAKKWFPRPDAVIVLRAPMEILLQRKQELSAAEISRQSATLDAMQFNAGRVVRADASLPAEEVARNIMSEITHAAAGS